MGENKFYKPKEVWWCNLGINVGFEQDGSGVMKLLAANCRGLFIFETLSVLNDFVCSPPRGKLEFSPTPFPLSAFIPVAELRGILRFD